MEELIAGSVLAGFAACFIILLADKLDARARVAEFLDRHGFGFLFKLVTCDFCLSFWLGVIIAALIVFFTGEPKYYLVPLFSTPVTRFLL